MNIPDYNAKLEKLVTSSFSKLSFIIAGFCLIFGLSFGLFIVTTDKYKASEMYIGNLLYTMDLRVIEDSNAVSSNTVTIPNDYTYTVMVNLGSLNPVRSKYKLQYQTTCTDCLVFISDVSGWNKEGFMNAQGVDIDSKTIKVIIINTSGSAATVNFAVTGGYAYNSYASIATTSGYTDSFLDYYIDSSSSKTLTTLVKDDTECTPTSSSPCYYGGEEKRNYITNNEKIYRMLGVYLINGIEYVKMIQLSNESVASYSNLSTASTTYLNSLDSTKTNYLTGDINAITKTDYINIGGLDSYINNGTEMITSSISDNNVYYVKANGELDLKLQSENSNLRPVLTLKTDAAIKTQGLGTVDNPYIIVNSLSDIIINGVTVDGTAVSNTPSTGVYIMTPTCTGGTAVWKDKTYLIEFNVTERPLNCNLSFVKRDIKFNTKVDGVLAPIPTTGNYTMTYNCQVGSAVLTWDNDSHSIGITLNSAPILCDINFTLSS